MAKKPVKKRGREKILHADEIRVEIDELPFEKSQFTTGEKMWDATTLVEAAKDEPTFRLPLIAIDLNVKAWSCENMLNFAQHFKRVEDTDLKYPVILDQFGYIVDGWHRVIKALVLGKQSILAKRLRSMPEPDDVVSE